MCMWSHYKWIIHQFIDFHELAPPKWAAIIPNTKEKLRHIQFIVSTHKKNRKNVTITFEKYPSDSSTRHECADCWAFSYSDCKTIQFTVIHSNFNWRERFFFSLSHNNEKTNANDKRLSAWNRTEMSVSTVRLHTITLRMLFRVWINNFHVIFKYDRARHSKLTTITTFIRMEGKKEPLKKKL